MENTLFSTAHVKASLNGAVLDRADLLFDELSAPNDAVMISRIRLQTSAIGPDWILGFNTMHKEA